jgi:hypothetical protein
MLGSNPVRDSRMWMTVHHVRGTIRSPATWMNRISPMP